MKKNNLSSFLKIPLIFACMIGCAEDGFNASENNADVNSELPFFKDANLATERPINRNILPPGIYIYPTYILGNNTWYREPVNINDFVYWLAKPIELDDDSATGKNSEDGEISGRLYEYKSSGDPYSINFHLQNINPPQAFNESFSISYSIWVEDGDFLCKGEIENIDLKNEDLEIPCTKKVGKDLHDVKLRLFEIE